jgi:hypothetical protein
MSLAETGDGRTFRPGDFPYRHSAERIAIAARREVA